jgi:hypothetical protein
MNGLQTWSALGLGLVAMSAGGCLPAGTVPVGQSGFDQLEQAVATLQGIDPRDIVLPDALVTLGDTVMLASDVVVVSDIPTQLVPFDLPNDTVLGLINDSGADLFIEFLADGAVQHVYVFSGETLLLDYPCLTEIDLVSSTEVDPVTGDVVVLTFSPETVSVGLDVIDLLQ